MITYRGGASGYALGGNPLSVTIPAAVRKGDVLLLLWASGAQPGSTPAGWDVVAAVATDTGKAMSTLYSRTAVDGDAGSVVSLSPPAAPGGRSVGVMAAYAGVDPAGLPLPSATAKETVDQSTHEAANLTTTAAGWVVQCLAVRDSNTAPSSTITPPPAYENRVQLAGGGTSQITAAIADTGEDVPAGAYDGTWTLNASTNNAVATAVALLPAADATGWKLVIRRYNASTQEWS